MAEQLQEAVSDVRRMAAAGDFTGARHRLTQFVTADPETPGANVIALEEQRRTLEVLESLEVIRRLLRDGKNDSAAQAASGIRDALSSHEYTRLGVLGAALALLDRAADLSRRAAAGDQSNVLRVELGAFVSHLGNELAKLQSEYVDQRLHLLNQPGRVTSTLGDLLSRRTSRANLMPAVEPTHAAPPPPRPAEVPAVSGPDGPVIGRILFAQEQQERVAAAPQTATMPGHVDMFDLVGSSAMRYWTVLAGAALACAALGYFLVTTAPQKYESDAVLQRSNPSDVSAPNLGDPKSIVKPVLFKTALLMITSEDFNGRVAKRLENVGWVDETGAIQKHKMESEQIVRALNATGEVDADGMYLIKFRATTTDSKTCQALVGAACDEIRSWYFDLRTADIGPHTQLYTQLLEETRRKLEHISARKLEEFSVKGSTSIGVSIQERSAQMTTDLRKAISDLQTEKINLTAAKQEEDALKEIADRIPPFEEMKPDARLEALKRFSEELNKEHLELARKREEYGPEHPIQKRIRNLQEDLRLVEKEIEELERTGEADTDKRKPNPLRTQADSRLVEARARSSVVQLRVTALELEIPKLETELGLLREQYEASLALRDSEKDLQDRRAMYQKTLDDLANVRNAAARELVISTAPAPGKAVARQELVGIAVGLVAGLVIGLGIAVALMRRRQAAESEMMA